MGQSTLIKRFNVFQEFQVAKKYKYKKSRPIKGASIAWTVPKEIIINTLRFLNSMHEKLKPIKGPCHATLTQL